jgi:hypothetical protein
MLFFSNKKRKKGKKKKKNNKSYIYHFLVGFLALSRIYCFLWISAIFPSILPFFGRFLAKA